MLKTFLIFILSVLSYNVYSQCTGNEPVVFLGNDTTICQGESITLTAPSGYGYYIWSDNSTNQTLSVSSTGNYSVEVGLVQNTNLVVNGTFESGNTGFTTGYNPGSGGAFGTLSNPGEYAVTTNPNLVHMYFSSCSDHTPSGAGRMLVVNGSGTPNTIVWQQTITVTPNTDYQFGTWVMSVVNTAASDLAQLQFSINGVQLGAIFSPSQSSCIWSQFTGSWNSGSNSTAVISIIGQNTVNTGNDFALDDITFNPVCKHTDDISVTVSPLPTQTTTTVAPSSCSGAPDGSITINCATGVQYSFDSGTTWQTSNVQTGLAAGTYTVVSKNAAGCTVSSTVSLVGTGTAPTQTTSYTSPTTCTGPPDGSITITSVTGVLYSFDGGTTWQASNTLTGLGAGTYTVMTQNAAGCTASSTVSIISTLSAPTQTTTTVSPTACSLTPDGSIMINSTNATQYSFDGGVTWSTTNIQTGLSAGTYTVMSQAASGCTTSSTVTLTGVAGIPPSITVSNDLTVCQNGIATIAAVGSGGTTFTYHWDDFSNTASSQTFSPTVTGYYGVSVENETGCTSEKDSVLVTVLQPLSGSVTPAVSVCPGQPGDLMVSGISGGMAPYTVVWSSGMTVVGSGNAYSATVPSNTVYTVGIMDACQSTPLVLTTGINILDFQIPMFTVDDVSQCEPGIFNIQNSMDPALIESSVWTISNGDSYTDQNQISLTDYEVGTYSVTLTVTSKSGCVDDITLTDGLVVYPNPVANFTYTPTNIFMFNTNVDFINQSIGAVDYIWRIEDGTPSSSTSQDISSTLPEGVTGEYDVLLVAISEHQCVDSVLQVITVYPEQIFYIPNTFTPNGDGVNQTWKVYMGGYDFSNYDLSVYNRWGELIWQTTDVNSEWDGTYKGNKVSDGIYTWSLVTKDIVTDKKYYYNGHLNIIR